MTGTTGTSSTTGTPGERNELTPVDLFQETPGPMTVSLATESDRADWDAYVDRNSDAAGYHEWAWRAVFERAFGHECRYLVARRGPVVGVLPLVEIRSALFGRTLTSLPFVNFGGVLAETDEVARALVDEAGRLAKSSGCKHVELRHIGRRFEDLPCRQHKVTMRLPLQTGMWDRIDRKARNQVRKAQKSDLTVVRGGAELVSEFYQVFARNMRDLGTPVYSPGFFREVLAAFPETARVFLVEHGTRAVAAGITIRHRDGLEVPWASSLREYRSQCPNNLLYWRIIEHAIDSGCRTLDFGRSTPNEGTYHFKEQWGARPEPLYWEYVLRGRTDLPDLSPANPKYRAAIAVWTRLPLAITNLIGPHIVRSIP